MTSLNVHVRSTCNDMMIDTVHCWSSGKHHGLRVQDTAGLNPSFDEFYWDMSYHQNGNI